MTARTKIDAAARTWYWTALANGLLAYVGTKATLQSSAIGLALSLIGTWIVHRNLSNGGKLTRKLVLLYNLVMLVALPLGGIYQASRLMVAPLSASVALAGMAWYLFLHIRSLSTLKDPMVKRLFV
jgi:hypothetical protein